MSLRWLFYTLPFSKSPSKVTLIHPPRCGGSAQKHRLANPAASKMSGPQARAQHTNTSPPWI